MERNNCKKWEVKFSDEVKSKLDDLPDEVYYKFSKIVKSFETGVLDPEKAGQPVDWVELDVKLICPSCESNDVQWLLDKNSDEVDFNCLECSESFWMAYKEYTEIVKKNPDKVVKG